MTDTDFMCDRPAKNDFTASTVMYLEKKGYFKPCYWYEENKYGELVPFGDNDADPCSRVDLFLKYGENIYVIELKERRIPSDNVHFITSGSFYNYEKNEVFQEYKEQGYIPLFADLYPDGVIRVWNMGRINASELASAATSIRRWTVDPFSPKTSQKRLLLPVSAAVEYKRIKRISDDK